MDLSQEENKEKKSPINSDWKFVERGNVGTYRVAPSRLESLDLKRAAALGYNVQTVDSCTLLKRGENSIALSQRRGTVRLRMTSSKDEFPHDIQQQLLATLKECGCEMTEMETQTWKPLSHFVVYRPTVPRRMNLQKLTELGGASFRCDGTVCTGPCQPPESCCTFVIDSKGEVKIIQSNNIGSVSTCDGASAAALDNLVLLFLSCSEMIHPEG